jgi:hypothetical protein
VINDDHYRHHMMMGVANAQSLVVVQRASYAQPLYLLFLVILHVIFILDIRYEIFPVCDDVIG